MQYPSTYHEKNKSHLLVTDMQIIHLADNYKPDYFCCLEDWAPEMQEGVPLKEAWYENMKEKGLRVLLAVDDKNIAGGMVQYIPIEYSFVDGRDLYFIHCIWVHQSDKGRGNYQKKGMGKALLHAAEADVRRSGAKGVAAWGISSDVWMPASWFKKYGYIEADRLDWQVLVWKPFADDAVAPKWFRQMKRPVPTPGCVTVTAFVNGWCTSGNVVHQRAKRAAAELGDKVLFREVDTGIRDNLAEWGIRDGLFIDSDPLDPGPPPPYSEIKKLIEDRLNQL
jgi:N-acetylglutamate synthase-like GNAT family acetyltransferase